MPKLFGSVETFTQQDGRVVKLKVFGDEFYARYETLNGYSAIREKGNFYYATLEKGAFVSTGIDILSPPPVDLPKHLLETSKVRQDKVKGKPNRHHKDATISEAASGGRSLTIGPNRGLLTGKNVGKLTDTHTVTSPKMVKGLTILVKFTDEATSITENDVSAMLNGYDYKGTYAEHGNSSSVKGYFFKMSSGRLIYENVVVGPVTLPHPKSHYEQTLLVADALQLAAPIIKAKGIDLRAFISEGTTLDAVSFMYAGPTVYSGELWPHNFETILEGSLPEEFRLIQGAQPYMLTSLGTTKENLKIGTFCHETGHLVCRFPDLYDYGDRDGDYENSAGAGVYCLMSSGNHLGNGGTPAPICGYLRDLAGWCQPVDLKVNQQEGSPVQLTVDYTSIGKYVVKKDMFGPVEYFVLESRMQPDLPGDYPSKGLAIWHCDIRGSQEWQLGTMRRHYQCELEQADGHRDLELEVNQGDGEDLFKPRGGVLFSYKTRPSSKAWDGRDSGLKIKDLEVIQEAKPVLKFKVV